MTDQMPIGTKRAVRVVGGTTDFAPPLAPLVMPKQLLAPEQGMIRRALAPLIARLALLRLSFRRMG